MPEGAGMWIWLGIAVFVLLLGCWLAEQRRRRLFEASMSPDELAGYRGFLATNHVVPGAYGWRDAARQILKDRTAPTRSV